MKRVDMDQTMRLRLLRVGIGAASVFTLCTFLRAVQAFVKVEHCFGAVGPGCDGAPFATPVKLAGGKVRMKVSVGSISHDNCCNLHPGGKMCSGLGSQFSNDGNCDKEWNKAFWNTQPSDGRHWEYVFDPSESSDLTPVRNGRRLTFASNYQGGGSVQVQETASTRKLSAPAGTNLDVGDQEFCSSGRASGVKGSFGKNWITCL